MTGEGLAEYARRSRRPGERRQRNHTWHARGTWVARPDTTLEGRVGGYTGYSSFGPIDPARVAGPPAINDSFRLLVLDNVLTITDDDRRTVTTSARLTHVRRIGGALHDIAAGVEFESPRRATYQGWPAGRREQYFDGVYRASVFWDGNDLRTRNERATFYVQDRWDVGRGLTLEPGLRVEWYGGRPRDGGEVFSTTPIAPRLGAAWDVPVGPSHRACVPTTAATTTCSSRRSTRGTTAPASRRASGRCQVAPGQFVEQSRVFVRLDRRVSDRAGPEAVARRSGLRGHRAPAQQAPRPSRPVTSPVASRNFIGYVDRRLDEWTPFTATDPGPDGRLGTPDDGGSLTAFVPYWWPSGRWTS